MIRHSRLIMCVLLAGSLLAGCGTRHIRTAKDITPGNAKETQLDWRYGANDVRIQTSKLTSRLLDQWHERTGYYSDQYKPRLIVTEVDNRTDMYIPTDMIRDIFEGVAIEDGRFTVLVGDSDNEDELDSLLRKITRDPKYANSSRLEGNQALAPQFLAKVRLSKATTQQRKYDLEDYRMTITLYDIETQEAIDSAWDVLRKKVKA